MLLRRVVQIRPKPSVFRAASSLSPSQLAHQESLKDPKGFWAREATRLDWFKPYDNVMELTQTGHARWFVGGKINTCYNAVDRHVMQGRGEQTAIIYDSPVTNVIRKLSYNQLHEQVVKLAAYLRRMGLEKGDRVVIYMPNIPEAAISMLACARLGVVHSVVFGGFAAPELATRIKDCKPKMIIAASCGIDGHKIIDYKYLLDNAIDLAAETHKVETTLIYQRPQRLAELVEGRDYDWEKELAAPVPAPVPCVPLASTDPLYILYTSGTTGQPKGVLRDNAGHAVALHWSMENIYGIKPGEVWWAASDVGWVVGHSFSVYGPLLYGATSILYEGKPIGTPDEKNFWRSVERHKVSAMFTAPTGIRAIKRLDPAGELPAHFDLSHMRTLFLAGERADPDTLKWAENSLKIPVRDHWWQTESGWPMCGNLVGMDGYIPVKYGSTYRPTVGYNVQILDDDNKPVPAGKLGKIAIKLPLPPGVLYSLYNNEERFVKSYLQAVPGYYDTGDAGYIDEEGYVYIMSRTDDVINVAGHRLSSGGMEEVIADHPDIAEVAVVGVKDEYKGHVPLGLIVLNNNVKKEQKEIIHDIIKMVRERIGPVASFKDAVVVDRLPKTRSGKILRATLRAIANEEEYKAPATIEDPAVLTEVTAIIKKFSGR